MAGEGGGGGGGKGGGSTAVAALLFCVYLGVNLGALLLAAQSQRQPRRYLNSTAVTLSEMLKFACSLVALYGAAPSSAAALRRILHTLLGQPDQMLRVAVPSLLYTIQNNVMDRGAEPCPDEPPRSPPTNLSPASRQPPPRACHEPSTNPPRRGRGRADHSSPPTSTPSPCRSNPRIPTHDPPDGRLPR